MKIHPAKVMLWLLVVSSGWAPVLANTAQTAAEEAEKEGVFTGYWGESFWTLIWFTVLLIVLWKFAWKPILAGLRSREEHIERQIAEAEKRRQEAEQVLQDYRAQLMDAERQGHEIITRRIQEAEEKAREIQAQTQKEMERIRLRMEADLERERAEAERQLWEQAAVIVKKLGREVFGKVLDEGDNQKLIQEAIERLREVEQGQS
ncbi:MAG TPA: F0F1 ATP synthase subunit B [Anaerohalosphaeraceae bacterium]|nr:F0F1 ATP synthase subunit B [Anaerohalosphaeraceae bacterium]HOL89529.1 F0F1 ATP synthase subunit B [Anaerohalosphaeraceae bacterium]HPP57167.1 F0F1 ATP synthase subunit B [Anaerohalosphaeraceae bacterium]